MLRVALQGWSAAPSSPALQINQPSVLGREERMGRKDPCRIAAVHATGTSLVTEMNIWI